MMEPPDSRTPRERMLDGDLYQADDPELVGLLRRARKLQDRYNRAGAGDEGEGDSDAARTAILVDLLGAIGEGSEIRAPLYCDYGFNTHIGSRVFVNYGLVALDVAPIHIGDDVQIGPYVQLLTPTHPLDAELRRAKWEAAEPIVIEDNAWLGGGAIVLPGITIGQNAVVGAGAVVTKDVPAGAVVVGNPARIRATHDAPPL